MNKLIYLILIAILFIGCADAVTVTALAEANPHVYGFWGGTWHGIITGPAFIGSLFSDDIAIYAVSNNGGWYDFGFVGGFFLIFKLIGILFKK